MIVKTKDTCSNQYRVDGTRLTVKLILRALVDYNFDIVEVMINYPSLTRDDVAEALLFTADLLDKKKL